MEQKGILWFRNDLRLHDNEALTEAIQKADKILPVFIFDERVFRGKTSFGFEKTAEFRTKFIIESVADLRKNLRALGSDLILRIGKPEEEIYKIALEIRSNWVFCNRERTSEEIQVQDQLEKKLWSLGQEIKYSRGKMLYHTADLPFPVSQVPDVFTNFRKEVENLVSVRVPYKKPDKISTLDYTGDRGELPTLETFGKKNVGILHIENRKLIGGETNALSQLNYYLNETQLIMRYKDTRNNMLGWDFSSKLSSWLSTGCLSPKFVFHKLKDFENNIVKNDSTYWLYFEMLWRDFFRLMGKKYENKIFKQGGMKHMKVFGKEDKHLLQSWIDGKTGIPLIDANMRQLNATGFMSNRGRQNAASFFVKDLKMNWVMGAEYFESMLIDYDPCSNYCNWNYIAGVGNDPREDRYFNIMTQSRKYDPNGDFIRYWLPELKSISVNYIHLPELMSIEAQVKNNVILGKQYPTSIINISHWAS